MRSFFQFEKNASAIFSAPIYLILKIPFIKRIYEKRGITKPKNVISDALNNSKNGTNMIDTHIHVGSLMAVHGWIMINIIQLFGLDIYSIIFEGYNLLFAIIILTVIVGLVTYFLFDSGKTYLDFFKEFKRLPKSRLRVIYIKSAIFYCSSIIGLILSFYLAVNFK